jgi:hypothetical protein
MVPGYQKWNKNQALALSSNDVDAPTSLGSSFHPVLEQLKHARSSEWSMKLQHA